MAILMLTYIDSKLKDHTLQTVVAIQFIPELFKPRPPSMLKEPAKATSAKSNKFKTLVYANILTYTPANQYRPIINIQKLII